MDADEKIIEKLEYLTRITSHYDDLSESEKKIADYILLRKTDILNMTTYEIAEIAGTSAATVVRFCRTLGFRGFNEFKFYIEREFLSPSDEIMQINQKDSLPVLKQKIFQFNKKVIDETEQIVDDEAIDLAVKTLMNAKNIHIYGEGASGISALYAFHLFMQIGIPCSYYNDPIVQITAASQLHRGDAAFCVVHSGRSKNVVDSMQEAKKQGATTISLTGHTNSPVTKYSDIVLQSCARKSEVMSDLPAARISEISIISLIQMALMVKNYDEHSGQIGKSKKILELKKY